MSVGCMGGVLDKVDDSLLISDLDQYEHTVREQYNISDNFEGDIVDEIR